MRDRSHIKSMTIAASLLLTLEGDSRGYIPDGVIENTYNVHNTESESFYNSRMLELFTDFLNLDLDRMRGYS